MAPSARTTHSDNSWLFFIYVFSMGHWILVLLQKTVRDFKAKDFGMEGHLVAGLYLLCATLFVSLSCFALLPEVWAKAGPRAQTGAGHVCLNRVLKQRARAAGSSSRGCSLMKAWPD